MDRKQIEGITALLVGTAISIPIITWATHEPPTAPQPQRIEAPQPAPSATPTPTPAATLKPWEYATTVEEWKQSIANHCYDIHLGSLPHHVTFNDDAWANANKKRQSCIIKIMADR